MISTVIVGKLFVDHEQNAIDNQIINDRFDSPL